MAISKKSEQVPKPMQEKFDRITAITNDFAQQHLNEEYAQLIRHATAALCRKRPSPLTTGKDQTWACGITHAVGMVNFLFDSSLTPHIGANDLYKWFGVAASTGQGKSKIVRDLLDMSPMDADWCLHSKLDDNPMAWMIMFDGLILDARTLPLEVQKVAHAKGLIPYLPGSNNSEQVEEPTAPSQAAKGTNSNPNALYVLDVWILGGPITEKFSKKNPEISRTIEIKGSNTLQDLHDILFTAFNRQEAHMYEFQVGGSRSNDPDARRYGLKYAEDEEQAGNVETTTIASLGLAVDELFGYWFDFGDDWWHQVRVVSISDDAPKKKYPCITNKVGASPPQYANF
jgi:Domain of unknown function (DUF6398)/Plasmid pRiA4b ORF-3-like protein